MSLRKEANVKVSGLAKWTDMTVQDCSSSTVGVANWIVINGMEADKYLCEQACQGHGGDGRELVNQSGRVRWRESCRTDTFSQSLQLILLIPSSLSSIAKTKLLPFLITPPLPFLSLPLVIRPPAYSPLPQLHLFPWKHRVKKSYF